jgi:plastocyanin
LSPTQTFTFTFNAGGSYAYHCSIHTSMKGTVKTRIQAMPGSGTITTTFTITWAKTSIPNGYNEDIQIQRPGGAFVNWKTNQKTLSATFTPDGGTGVYRFRARLQQDTTAGHRTGYSPVAQITVN